MSSNSVCNHTRDKQIGLPLRGNQPIERTVSLNGNFHDPREDDRAGEERNDQNMAELKRAERNFCK